MAKKKIPPEKVERIRTKDFFDCIAPSIIKFLSDYYIVNGWRKRTSESYTPPMDDS